MTVPVVVCRFKIAKSQGILNVGIPHGGPHREGHSGDREGAGAERPEGEKERAGRIGMTLHRTARGVTRPYYQNGTITTGY